jgi:rhodanese-related sulfurtransferase
MTDIFKDYGIVSGGILNVSPGEAFELVKRGALIIDVREDYLGYLKTFDVPDVSFFPKSKLLVEFENIPSDRYLIFADSVGLRSKEVVIYLKEKGLEKIANMAGGLVAWERDGLPVKLNISERLTGSCMCQLKQREGKKIKRQK